MEQPPTFNFGKFVLIALPALILIMAIWGGFNLIAPLFDSVEPETAAARYVSPDPNHAWQPFPLNSPNGEQVARLMTDSSGYPIIWVQDIANDEYATSLTLHSPSAYYDEGAWLDDDTLAIRIDNGAVIWRWRDSRLITPRRLMMGVSIVIALVGLGLAYRSAKSR